MALETGTYISDLVVTNPVNATDQVAQGDDHIRLIKSTLKATFANVTGAVTATHTQLNVLATDGAGAGMLADIAAIADPGADRLLGWDDSASAAVAFSLVSGELEFSGTTLGTGDNVPLLDEANTFTATQTISGTTPELHIVETDGGTWALIGFGSGDFGIQRQDGGAVNAIKLSGDGAGTITEVEINGTTLDFNGNADISGTLDVTGAATFLGTLLSKHASFPDIGWWNTSAGTDAKRWQSRVNTSGTWQLFTVTDAGSSDDTAISITRAGSSVSEIDLTAPTLDFNGNLDLDGTTHTLDGTTITVDGSTSLTLSGGSGTVTLSGTEIDLTATTLDFNGNADISGTLTVHDTLTLADAAGLVYGGETVELGAADSGGTGFKILRVPNTAS